jgi:hypothetical protein
MDAYQEIVEAMSELPISLKPVHKGDPNKPISLYKGSLELQQVFTVEENDGSNEEIKRIETGTGYVEFAWFPLPCLKFEFSNENQTFHLDWNKPVFLKLLELNISVPIHLSNVYQDWQLDDRVNKVLGRIKEPIIQGSGHNLSYVMFHVVNLSDFNANCKIRPNEIEDGWRADRVNFEVVEKNWKLTLDKLQSISEYLKELKTNGGFAITHIGKLERLNGEVFSHVEVKQVLDIFQNFLSFARGFRVPIVLLAGYDNYGEKVWEYWDLSRGDSWQGVKSLLPESNAEGQFLADVFPGFLQWWQHENWNQSVRLILHCYLEANIGAGGAEGAIILEQTALELIAYILGNSERTAAEKIRTTLTAFGISKNVPPDSDIKKSSSDDNSSKFTQDMQALENYFSPLSIPILENLRQVIEEKNSRAEQEDQKWEDGPRALTGIRNDILPWQSNRVARENSNAWYVNNSSD